MSSLKPTLSEDDYKKLCHAVKSSVRKALSTPCFSEPQLVARIVCLLPNAINKARIGSTAKLTAGGIFVHQKPKVKSPKFPSPSPKSVEIGDLLLLVRDENNKRRALLLQAKRTSCITEMPDNKNQHYLYSKQPQFEYINSGKKLNTQRRKITGFDTYSGCKYLLFDDSLCPPSLTSWVAQPSWPNLSNFLPFETEVIDFIQGYAGKPYKSKPRRTNRNWDQVIKDLIDSSTGSAVSSTIINSGVPITQRSNLPDVFLSGQATFFSILENAFEKKILPRYSTTNDNLIPPVFFEGDEESSDNDSAGLSIIEFEWHDCDKLEDYLVK